MRQKDNSEIKALGERIFMSVADSHAKELYVPNKLQHLCMV